MQELLFSGTLLCAVILTGYQQVLIHYCNLILPHIYEVNDRICHSNIQLNLSNIIWGTRIYIYICVCVCMCVCVCVFIYIYIYIYMNKSFIFQVIFLLSLCGQIPSPSTKLHCLSLQFPAGFKYTAWEPAWIILEKDQCILRLHSQSHRHCK